MPWHYHTYTGTKQKQVNYKTHSVVSFFTRSSKKGSVSMSEPLSWRGGGAAAAAGFAVATDLSLASPTPFSKPSPAFYSQQSSVLC